jgi:DNA-binding MarR family transcriptional regulator
MAGRPSPTLRLEQFLPYRLNVVAATVSEGLARVYSQRFQLDIPGWRVIATLGQFGEATATAIGQHSHMHKTKVSRAVAELTARALVERAPSPRDRREAILTLSDAGRRMYEEIVPLAQGFEAQLLARLTETDTATLDALLDRLLSEAEQMGRNA